MKEHDTVDSELFNEQKEIQKTKESLYNKLLILGIVESISWITFLVCLIVSIFTFNVTIFHSSLPFLIIAASTDIYVLKTYSKTEEFRDLRNDFLSILNILKRKLSLKK
jgi:hypothetical protein